MIFLMKSEDNKLVNTQDINEANWIHVENPSGDEIENFRKLTNIPGYILKDALDVDEMPHVDLYDDNYVIFIDAPIVTNLVPANQTRPLCIVLGKEKIYSFASCPLNLVSQVEVKHIEHIQDTKDILMIILLTIMSAYIKSIKAMENDSNWDHNSFKNPSQKESVFFQILDHQKSLIDYKTSVETNHITLQKINELLEADWNKHQGLIMNNLITESEQIAQMCAVFGDVLEATAGIAESIVSNNLNDLMKTLTSLTILVSLPTIISGIYMTNTQIPAPFNHYLVPVFLSLFLVTTAFVIFKRTKML